MNRVDVDAVLTGVEIPKPAVIETEQKVEETQDVSYEPEVKQESRQDSRKQEDAKKSDKVDEYGNEVTKPKLYTEEELNRIVRERLSRGRQNNSHPQFHQQNNVQPVQQEESEDWRQELRTEIKNTMSEVYKQQAEENWRNHELKKQADFEDKFTRGMSKYNDFRDVVEGKPITDAMLVATRAMDNPAAFIYAVAKHHPQELDRIARIEDGSVQALEMGRLEERMKKSRSVSNSPRPINTPSGDLEGRGYGKKNVDDLIREDMERQYKRYGKL